MKSHRGQTPRGLTLVELLVSLSLVAAVGLAAFAVLAGGLRIWERGESLGVRERQVHLVLEQMRRDLSSARVFQKIPLEGRYDQVSFCSLVPVVYRRGDEQFEIRELGRVTYFFSPGQRFLFRSDCSYRSVRHTSVREGGRPVLEGLEGVRFSYYKLDAQGGTGSWSSSWDEEEAGLPLAVKIELSYRDDPREPSKSQTVIVPLPSGGSAP